QLNQIIKHPINRGQGQPPNPHHNTHADHQPHEKPGFLVTHTRRNPRKPPFSTNFGQILTIFGRFSAFFDIFRRFRGLYSTTEHQKAG
ncbi:MAG: hypothetical protein K2L95_02970, partial [Alphaproteobacteria bacterium]|nr:hypothetical protein [Alphaproteobacteria bacterium]